MNPRERGFRRRDERGRGEHAEDALPRLCDGGVPAARAAGERGGADAFNDDFEDDDDWM